jgi:alpha-galactosidase
VCSHRHRISSIILIYIEMRFYILLILASFCWCLDNGMGLTPPMAWNSWNKFGCKINETLIKQTADAMVKEGYLSAGYSFLNLDDCWAYKRNSTKHIQADPKTFPSGIPSLSQYIHSKGLKFGLYSDAGLKTCAGRPGSLYH